MPGVTPLAAVKALPKAVSALVLHPRKDVVLAAAEDRSLRTFDLQDGRPVGAVINLPDEVAAMVVDLSSGGAADEPEGWGSVWIACGTDAHQLRLQPTPFLRTFQAALIRTIALGKEELNDLAISPDGRQLAWCGDDGRLGVLDLATGIKTWMKGKHANIAGSVSFLPHHPGTLFSTGYDVFARTWSSTTGQTVDTLFIEPPPGSATSMAPTFPISLHTSSFNSTESLVAVGTADGAIWLSVPDLEVKKGKKKRVGGIWRQLDRLGRFEIEGEGAGNFAVGVAFIPRAKPADESLGPQPPSLSDYPLLVTLSHTGAVLLAELQQSPKGFSLKKWLAWHTANIAKCNALVVSGSADEEGRVKVLVGGIGRKTEGVIEGWTLNLA